MKNKRLKKRSFKAKLLKGSFYLLGPTAALSAYNLQDDYYKKVEKIVSIPSTITSELIKEQAITIDQLNEKYNGNDYENIHITDKKLDSIHNLSITMLSDVSLNYLTIFNNLDTITIRNAELLTDEDIEIINNLKVKEVILNFDLNSVNTMRENRFDVSRIKKVVKVSNNFIDSNEFNNLVLLSYLKKYDDDIFIEQESVQKYIEMDRKLDAILKDANVNQALNDREKILLISNYLVQNLEYDKVVDAVLSKGYLSNNDIREANKLLDAYNDRPISSVFDQNEIVKSAVCINYASLVDLLCLKSGVKTRVVTGYEGNVSHAWNLAYLDNNKKCFIDITSYDSFDGGRTLKQYADSGQNRTNPYYNKLINEIFLDKSLNFTTYNMNKKESDLDKEESKIPTKMYNENIAGTKILNKELDYQKDIGIGVGAGVLSLLLVSITDKIKRRRRRY